MKQEGSKRVQFSIRMDESIRNWLEVLASLRGYDSLNDYIEDLGRREVEAMDEATIKDIIALREKLKTARPDSLRELRRLVGMDVTSPKDRSPRQAKK